MLLLAYAIRILLMIFGVLMVFAGIRGLLRSKMDSYDGRSFTSSLWGSLAVIILGFLLASLMYYGINIGGFFR